MKTSHSINSRIHTHITLKIVGFPRQDDIIGVWQTSPVVETSDVVGVVDLDLVLLGKFKGHHVYWQVELGLGQVEVLLVQGVTGDLG